MTVAVARKNRPRATTAELAERLRLFQHREAAERLEWLQARVDELEESDRQCQEAWDEEMQANFG